MINNLTNLNILLIVCVIVVYLIIAVLIVRNISKKLSHIYEHHEYIGETDSKTYDHKISSKLCPICDRFDSLHINTDDLTELCEKSSKGIGQYDLLHSNNDNDHIVTHYFNIEAKWLGDDVSQRALQQAIDEEEIADMNREFKELVNK